MSRCHLTCPWKTFALHLKSQVCLNKLIRKKWSVHEVRNPFFHPQQIFPKMELSTKTRPEKMIISLLSLTSGSFCFGNCCGLFSWWQRFLALKNKAISKLHSFLTVRFWEIWSQEVGQKAASTNPSRAKKSKCRGGFCWTWSLIFQERGGYLDVPGS